MWNTVAAAFTTPTFGDWLLLIVTLLILLYIWGSWTYDYFQRRGIHYIKPKLPFVGNMTSAFFGTSSMPDMINNLYEKGKAHSVLGMFEFRRPILMVRDPQLLKLIAVKDFDHFTDRRTMDFENVEPFFCKNLSNLKGDHWRRMRATLSPAFTTSKIKGMFPLISQCAEQMTENLSNRYAQSNEGQNKTPMEIDMKDIFGRTATDIIGSVAFGVQCDSLKERENEFYLMGKSITTITYTQSVVFIGLLLAPKLVEKLGVRFLNGKAMDFLESLVHETMQERQKKGIYRPDLLQLLIEAQKEDLASCKPEDEEEKNSRNNKIEDDEISAQAIMFFFAGFETISITLSFLAYALSVHQGVQKRLQEEVDEVFKATNGKLTYEDLHGMKYLDAVINETLRLYPPGPVIDRQCTGETVLPATENSDAVRIPKDTIISIPVIGLHLDPEYWTDPATFDPDRFSDENKHNIKPFTFLPFGGGPRICIAQRFAMMEIKLLIVHVLRTFDLYHSPKVKYPLEYQKGFGFTPRPKGGFLCRLKPRDG